MRELKFRAWESNLKFMQKPFSLISDNGMLGKDGEIHKADYIIMQYTGLKDKNGKEIYEGDIVKLDYSGNDIWQVLWEYDKWQLRDHEDYKIGWANCQDDPYHTNWRDVEVIGNIYENPELLT